MADATAVGLSVVGPGVGDAAELGVGVSSTGWHARASAAMMTSTIGALSVIRVVTQNVKLGVFIGTTIQDEVCEQRGCFAADYRRWSSES